MVKNRTASLPQSEFTARGVDASTSFNRVVCEKHPVAPVGGWFILILFASCTDFTVRDSPAPQCVVPNSASLPVMAPKERKDAVTPSCPLSGSSPNSDRSLRLYKSHIKMWLGKREMGVMMFIHVVPCVTVDSVRVQRRSLTSRRWTADQKSSCRLRCRPPPLTPLLEKVGDE